MNGFDIFTAAGMMHDGTMHGGMGSLSMALMALFWLVLLVVLVAGAYLLLTRLEGDESADAFETLRERYARGEIDEEEYRERKQVLEEE